MIINTQNKQPWQVKEEFKKINRTLTDVIVNFQGPETQEIEFIYPDFELLAPDFIGRQSLLYHQVKDNEKIFKVGNLELEYIREESNMAYRNERSVELALGKWFLEKYNNNVFEVGDVTCNYSFFQGHTILDPSGPYSKAIRKSAELVDYKGLDVLSISTLEHMNDQEYNNNDPQLGIKVLQKIHIESNNYLITIPIGGWRAIENFLMSQDEIKYIFLQRKNLRGETNNWIKNDDKNLFYLEYGHSEYCKSLYGNALAICIITDQEEIINQYE